METNKETRATIQSRLDVLRKGIISEENSVNYYQTLIDKTSEDSEANIGMRRMYTDLMSEEKKHVERFQELIAKWEQKLKEL
ncbi:MAG: hypothetical protein HOF21_02750 [Nitrospina sp.]|jgi:rubrerythrin|nr:hypothetical protein [Nitrospina sp.]MBT5633141.1 hypothetical protein [Nitrospina sp.]